jgi:hypothetical protein
MHAAMHSTTFFSQALSMHVVFHHWPQGDHGSVCLQVALEQVPVLRPTAQLLDALEAGYGAPGQDDSSARLIMEQASAQPDRCELDVAAPFVCPCA